MKPERLEKAGEILRPLICVRLEMQLQAAGKEGSWPSHNPKRTKKFNKLLSGRNKNHCNRFIETFKYTLEKAREWISDGKNEDEKILRSIAIIREFTAQWCSVHECRFFCDHHDFTRHHQLDNRRGRKGLPFLLNPGKKPSDKELSSCAWSLTTRLALMQNLHAVPPLERVNVMRSDDRHKVISTLNNRRKEAKCDYDSFCRDLERLVISLWKQVGSEEIVQRVKWTELRNFLAISCPCAFYDGPAFVPKETNRSISVLLLNELSKHKYNMKDCFNIADLKGRTKLEKAKAIRKLLENKPAKLLKMNHATGKCQTKS